MNARDRLFWTEFLELYRSLPAVWKVKSPEYSSRALKSIGYEQLVCKLREVEPDADRALVVKKINSFRTNFRRDLRKRELDTDDEPFESTLWYFELLSFLEGQEENDSCHKASSPEAEAQSEYLPRLRKRRRVTKAELPSAPASPAPSASPILHSANRLRRKRYVTLSVSEALAQTWRSQFDELTSRQQLLARKLISDVLYHGCLQQLEPTHVTQLQQMMLRSSLLPQLEDVSLSPRADNLCSPDNYDENESVDADG